MTGLLYSPEPAMGADVVSTFEVVVMMVPGVVEVKSPTKETMGQGNQSSLTSSCSRPKLL